MLLKGDGLSPPLKQRFFFEGTFCDPDFFLPTSYHHCVHIHERSLRVQLL